MPRIERHANVVWAGNLARGTGRISAGTGAFSDLEYSIAVRVGKGAFDDDLLRLLNVPRSILPEVFDCNADFGLIEVGTNLNPIQIGNIEQIFAGGDEVIGRDGDGVDGSGEGSTLIVVVVTILCGCDGSAGVGKLSLGLSAISCTVALSGAGVRVLYGRVSGFQPLFRRGYFAGGGSTLLLQLFESG